MPRLSDDALLQHAIDHAIRDRQSFADCYNNEGEWAEKAFACVSAMKALKGKKIASLCVEELQAAFEAFIYAEQWNDSLADAQSQKTEKVRARKLADAFRAVRLRRWGRTTLEIQIATATEYVLRPGDTLPEWHQN